MMAVNYDMGLSFIIIIIIKMLLNYNEKHAMQNTQIKDEETNPNFLGSFMK